TGGTPPVNGGGKSRARRTGRSVQLDVFIERRNGNSALTSRGGRSHRQPAAVRSRRAPLFAGIGALARPARRPIVGSGRARPVRLCVWYRFNRRRPSGGATRDLESASHHSRYGRGLRSAGPAGTPA